MSGTAERVGYTSAADNYVFNRQLRAYKLTKEQISGKILEVGSGIGYGIKELAPIAEEYIALDKYETEVDQKRYPNVKFIQEVIPPFASFENDTFDFVVCFQVIEHIEEDVEVIAEIKRVLKPGGKLFMTTPNINTTLTRNPWHIREYTTPEFESLIGSSFQKFDLKGIYGNDVVMQYYNDHKASLHKILKYDVFNLQYRLPSWILRLPYDFLDRVNRHKSHNANPGLLAQIDSESFYLEDVSDQCLDFFVIAEA
ncbi:MAG: SAM-dependent methyltransferase [Saprospiraceae bacterium]|jgi:SAM-dependent methyltransferase